MAEVLPLFSLAKIQGLVSEAGTRINGLHVVVTDHHTTGEQVRNVVYILERKQKDGNKCRIKTENLIPLQAEDLNPSLSSRYKAKLCKEAEIGREREDIERQKAVLRKLCDIPGHTPSLELRCEYAVVLRETGEVAPATELLRKMIQEAVSRRHRILEDLRMYLAECHLKLGQVHEALDVALQVKTSEHISGRDRKLVFKMFKAVSKGLYEARSGRLLEACRAMVKLVPDDGVSVNNVGALLCSSGNFQDGISTLQSALSSVLWHPEDRIKVRANIALATLAKDRSSQGQNVHLAVIRHRSLLILQQQEDGLSLMGSSADRQDEGQNDRRAK